MDGDEIEDAGLFKHLSVITSADGRIEEEGARGKEVMDVIG